MLVWGHRVEEVVEKGVRDESQKCIGKGGVPGLKVQFPTREVEAEVVDVGGSGAHFFCWIGGGGRWEDREEVMGANESVGRQKKCFRADAAFFEEFVCLFWSQQRQSMGE